MTYNSPRPPCANCVRKHLAQACALLQESLQGYPEHRWLAIGHMAEAEAEVEGFSDILAGHIRVERKALEGDPGYKPPFEDMIHAVSVLAEGADSTAVHEEPSGGGSCGVCRNGLKSSLASRVAMSFLTKRQ